MIVLDWRGPAQGSTDVGTALVLYEIDEPLPQTGVWRTAMPDSLKD